MPPPKFILGNITFGKPLSKEDQDRLVPTLRELGVREADLGPAWPLQVPGVLEPMIGTMVPYLGPNFLLDSRVECKGNGDGTMTANAISKSLNRTLSNLGIKKVSIYESRLISF